MDECCCDYHHGLWMTCHYCTQRLEDDYFEAIVLATKMAGDVSGFGYSRLVQQQTQVFACGLTDDEMDERREALKKLVVEGRANR